MLLGAVAKVLADEGIDLISSTEFLEPLLAQEGPLTEGVAGVGRGPNAEEAKNIEYGLGVARAVAGFDIGQTVVVAAQACVAVEAMEGTDAAIARAGALMRSLGEGNTTLERRLTVVKVAKPGQGTADTDLLRVSPVAYADGIDSPSLPSNPSARVISDILNNQTDPNNLTQDLTTVDGNNLSDFGYAFGQFMDHDMDLTPTDPNNTLLIAADLLYGSGDLGDLRSDIRELLTPLGNIAEQA